MRGGIDCGISRDTMSATIKLPSLEPGIQMMLPLKLPVYRFIIQLGVAADFVYDEKWKDYTMAGEHVTTHAFVQTEWLPAKKKFEGQTFELVLAQPELVVEGKILVVSTGVEMGNMTAPCEIERVKYSGAGKILAVG